MGTSVDTSAKLEDERDALVMRLYGVILLQYVGKCKISDVDRPSVAAWLIEQGRLESVFDFSANPDFGSETVSDCFDQIQALQTGPEEFEWFTERLQARLNGDATVVVSYDRRGSDEQFIPTLIFRRPGSTEERDAYELD